MDPILKKYYFPVMSMNAKQEYADTKILFQVLKTLDYIKTGMI